MLVDITKLTYSMRHVGLAFFENSIAFEFISYWLMINNSASAATMLRCYLSVIIFATQKGSANQDRNEVIHHCLFPAEA